MSSFDTVTEARTVTAPTAASATERPGAGSSGQYLPMLLLILLGEFALAVAHVVWGLGLIAVLVGHFIIVCVAWRSLLGERRPGDDITARALIVMATAAAGPVGALCGLFFARAARPPAAVSPLLGDWYRRIALSAEIDPVTELCDNVGSGRTMNLASPVPQSFLSVMISGAIADQQTALGLIARRFHPDYLPALARALKSSEPVVRVQAAAVVARIRDQLQRRVRTRIAELDATVRKPDAAAALGELAKAVASGLLDATDRVRAEAILAREPVGTVGGKVGDHQAGVVPGYKALRVSRRRRRIVRSGWYRIRRLKLLPARGGAA